MNWAMLHGGALGDLVLGLQLAVRVPAIRRSEGLTVYSRVTLPRLRVGSLQIWTKSSDSIGLDWLFRDADGSGPPENLQRAISGCCVLNLLTTRTHSLHGRLLALQARTCLSVDPARVGSAEFDVHVVKAWERQLAEQGGAVRSCAQLDRHGPRFHLVLAPQAPIERADFVIHPGSGGDAKCWALSRYADLARALAADRLSGLFVLGPAEIERWPFHVVEELRREFRVQEFTDSRQLAERLAAARLYIGNDSGPTHLAAALGTPTIALFGPTRVARWRPLGRAVEALQGDPQRDDRWGISLEAIRSAALRLCSPA